MSKRESQNLIDNICKVQVQIQVQITSMLSNKLDTTLSSVVFFSGQIDGQEITATAVLTQRMRPAPRRLTPPRRMPPPPPMWRRTPPRMRRRSVLFHIIY